MERIRRIIIVCAVLAAVARPAWGSDLTAQLRDFAVRTWSKSDGLPDAPVTFITQTRDGYLWIGTSAGLFRFDGVKFLDTPLLPAGAAAPISVTALCEDTSGGLWIGSQRNGVYRWQEGQVKHFGLTDGLVDERVTSLAFDGPKRIWIGTQGGLNSYDGKDVSTFTTADGLQSNWVLNVQAARSGTVWITTSGGMCRYSNGQLSRFHFPHGDLERDQEFLQAYEDRRGNLWAFSSTYLINLAEGKRINYFPGEKSDVTRIWSLCEGRGGRLWLGASGRGVFCFDGTKFEPITLNEGRWPNDVRTICEDQEGNLWLGISGVGLVQLHPQAFVVSAKNLGLPPGPATCVVADGSGRICVGMDSGGIYRGVGGRFEVLNVNYKFLEQDIASSLCFSPDGTLWAGTIGTGLYQITDGRAASYTTGDGLADDAIHAICADKEGVWAGTRGGTVQWFDDKGRITTFTQVNGLPGTAITAIICGRDGGLWIGTASGDLVHAQSGFKNVTPVVLPLSLTGKAILGLCEDAHGGVWLGTEGGGLGYVKGSVRRAWDSQDGLPDNVVSGLAEDEDSNMWLVTPRGLCRIDNTIIAAALAGRLPPKVKLLYETESAQPRESKYGGPRATRGAGGRLWFALDSGLVGVEVQGREADNPPPPVHIETMLFNNKPLPLDNASVFEGTGPMPPPLALPANQQALEFRFAGLSFASPERVRFRHKLEGFDTEWTEGSERQVRYGPLPVGNYNFHVTACNAEGVWNEIGANVAFIIPTPLWRTPWAFTLAGLAATVLAASVVRSISHRRLRMRLEGLMQQQTMQRERMRIAQNMHDEIGSKLTKISYLSERAKVELRGAGKAEGKIDSIAVTSRDLLKALDEIVWAVNPQNDSLEHLAAYFCQYAREYFQDTALECDLRMQSHLPDVEMSAETRHNLFLAFEEALSNVLKHSHATRLSVDIAADAQRLRIAIRDNGWGFNLMAVKGGKATGGNGLRNIRQRLTAVSGLCDVESSPGAGTCINLSVPLVTVKLRKQ